MSKSTLNDLRDLSDEDVRLLYEIVTTAENSKSPPIRALFGAYDRVLAERGISKEHDHLYLRFLLRMGEERKEGQGIFDQFEALLIKLGFQIAFDMEEEKDAHLATETKLPESRNAPSRVQAWQTEPFRPSRRASFDSAYDSNADSQRSNGRLPFTPARSQSIDDGSRRRSKLDSEGAHGTSNGLVFPEEIESPMLRGRMKTRDDDARLKECSARSHPVLQLEKDYNDQHPKSINHSAERQVYSDQEMSDEGSDLVEIEDPGPRKVAQMPEHSRRTLWDDRKAETHAKSLKYHHMAAKAVSFFRNWRTKSSEMTKNYELMSHIAILHDTEILKRQALQQWTAKLQDRRKLKEIEQFFDKLESRAIKARNLFLLSKAFTHWAQCASEESSRRSAARQHILRTRYFNAWKDATVVNELKVQRYRLSKFFNIWKRCTANVIHREDQALDFAEATSIGRAYRTWFWRFCEQKAPAWFHTSLKRKFFTKWADLMRQSKIRESWATDFRSLELVRRSTLQWTQRSDIIQQHQQEAMRFRWRTVVATTVETMQRELQVAPLQAQFNRAVNLRIARSALHSWHGKTLLALQARDHNDLRIMKNAWTTWNDSIRCQALRRVIDDRLLLQALYNWVLAERLALFERVRGENSMSKAFSRWRGRLHELSSSLGQARHTMEIKSSMKQAASIVKRWSCMAQARGEEEVRAQRFYERNLTQTYSKAWISRHNQIHQLENWARDARFYVLTNRSLGLWHEAAVNAKRMRRREAYSAFRGKTKKTAALKILQQWRTSAALKADLRRHGDQIQRQRLVITATNLLGFWVERTAIYQHSSAQAAIVFQDHCLQRHTQKIVAQHQELQELQSLAENFWLEKLDKVSITFFRKAKWRLFQVRELPSPESLAQLHRQKHHRNILRYWAEKARQKQNVPEREDISEVAHQSPTQPTIEPLTNTVVGFTKTPPMNLASRQKIRLQRFPPLNGSAPATVSGPTAQTNTPAYLRTPSRAIANSERKKARIRTTATELQVPPPNTPVATHITPFMNRLKQQYGGSLSGVNGFPKSNLSTSVAGDTPPANVAFEDLPGGANSWSVRS